MRAMVLAYLTSLQEIFNKQGEEIQDLIKDNGTLPLLVAKNANLKRMVEMQNLRIQYLEEESWKFTNALKNMHALQDQMHKIEMDHVLKE